MCVFWRLKQNTRMIAMILMLNLYCYYWKNEYYAELRLQVVAYAGWDIWDVCCARCCSRFVLIQSIGPGIVWLHNMANIYNTHSSGNAILLHISENTNTHSSILIGHVTSSISWCNPSKQHKQVKLIIPKNVALKVQSRGFEKEMTN